MQTLALISFVVTVAGLVIVEGYPFPADHREDTVLPFSLSPGNVNLETYYLDKQPPQGSSITTVGDGTGYKTPPAQQDPVDDNMFVAPEEYPEVVYRTKREPSPQHHHHHHGHHHHGHYNYGFYRPNNYGNYNYYNPYRFSNRYLYNNYHDYGHHHHGHHHHHGR